MSSKEETTAKEELETHEDEQMVVKENESNGSDDEDAMIAPEPFLTPNVAPSTHDDMHQEESTTIQEVMEKEEEVSKPKLALSSSSSSSPDLESLEADSWSSEHMETLANHSTIASTHERTNNVKTKKKEVQFSSLAPELLLVSSSSNDDGDSAASERSWTCADSVATDSIHSIKQSPTMLTIDTTDTSTTNHTHDIKDSPTTMDQVQEQQAEEQVEKQRRAKLDNFQPVALQPQNSANTLTACLKDSYLPISATDTVLGGDTEPRVSSSNTVPFAFDEEEEEEEDIQECPSRLLDMQEHEYVLHEIARIIGSQALVQDLATLYYDRDELHMVQDKEFCTAVELALQKSKRATQDNVEGSSCMCAENPLKCAVADEQWDSLVESVTAVAQCKGGADDDVAVAKSTSTMRDVFLSQDQVDEIKASLENDRQQIALVLDSWVKTIQASAVDSVSTVAVTRDLSNSQEKVKEIADSLEQGGHEFVGLIKSWAEEIQAPAPTTTTSDTNATELEAFASETSSLDENAAKNEVACREIVLYKLYPSVAVPNKEAVDIATESEAVVSEIFSSDKILAMINIACREVVLYNHYRELILYNPYHQRVAVANKDPLDNEALQASTGRNVLGLSETACRHLVLRSLVKSKADDCSSEFQAVLFLRMMAQLFEEAFGDISKSLQDNLKQADGVVQGLFVCVYKLFGSLSAETSGSHLSIKEMAKPTEPAVLSESSTITTNEDTHIVMPLKLTIDTDAVVAETNDTCIDTIEPDASQSENMPFLIMEGKADFHDALSQEPKLNESINYKSNFVVEPTVSAVEATVLEELGSGLEETATSEPFIVMTNKDTHLVVPLESISDADALVAETNAIKTNDTCIDTIEPDASQSENIPVTEGKVDFHDALPQEPKLNESINYKSNVVVEPTVSAVEATELEELGTALEETVNEETATSELFIIMKNEGTHRAVPLESIIDAGLPAVEANDTRIDAIEPDASQSANMAIPANTTESQSVLPQEPKTSDFVVDSSEQSALETLDVSSNNAPIDESNLTTVKASLKKDSKNIQKSFQSILDDSSSPFDSDGLERHLRELINYFSSIFDRSMAESEANGTNKGLSNNEVNDKSLGGQDEVSIESPEIKAAASNDAMLFFQVLGDIFEENPNRIEASFKEDYQAIRRLVESHFVNNQDISSDSSCPKSKGNTEEKGDGTVDKPVNLVGAERAKPGNGGTGHHNSKTVETKNKTEDIIDITPVSIDCKETVLDREVDDIMAFRDQLDMEDTLFESEYNNITISPSDKEKVNPRAVNNGSKTKTVAERRRPVKKARKTEPMNECEEVLSPSTLETKVVTLPSDSVAESRRPAKKARKNEPVNEYKEIPPPSALEKNVVTLQSETVETVAERRRPSKKARNIEPKNERKKFLSLEIPEKKVVFQLPEMVAKSRRPAKDARKIELMNKYKDVLSPSTPKKKVVKDTKSGHLTKNAQKLELMNECRDILPSSSPENKVAALQSETVAERRRLSKKARKPTAMKKYKDDLPSSMPEKKVVVLSHRASSKKMLSAKMREKSAKAEASDTETTLDCSDDNDDSNSISELPVGEQGCCLGNIFDGMLENALGPYHLSDDSSLSSSDGQREVKPSLRDLSSKRHQTTSLANGESSSPTRESSNGSIGANGGPDQQRWRRPKLNRKVRYSQWKGVDRAFGADVATPV